MGLLEGASRDRVRVKKNAVSSGTPGTTPGGELATLRMGWSVGVAECASNGIISTSNIITSII
jgi:hypothetical protein